MSALPEGLSDALADRYIIDREIGHGATATVYRAQDRKHDRSVAIKVLSPDIALTVRTERFLREIQIAARLQHPHILPLHDSGTAEGLPYYVMPYVAGETLRDRLEREGPLPLEEAVRITREVASALDYAHAQGVVHRDIKPGNILLSAGHAVVADFGIARAITAAETDQVTATGVSLGTPAYMSPEQVGGEPLDGRSDIYSLGCVVYEMLAAQPPFVGPTAQSILAQHLVDRVPALRRLRPDSPASVERVLERALAKRPAGRFATAGEFAQALSSPQSVRYSRWPPSVDRRRAATALVALVVLGATGWAWMHLHHGSTVATAKPGLDPAHIAVLYFDDLSNDRSLGPVATGLTEDLIDELGHVRRLHVISANGVRSFRGRPVRLDSIATELGVGTIVSGSVARSKGRLRVAVRLIDPTNGRQLHSHMVERAWGDLFVLQDSIAADIASFLREGLGQEVRLHQRRAGTTSVAAWEFVQRADRLREDAEGLTRAGDSRAVADVASADSLYAIAESLDRRWIVPIVARGRLGLTMAQLQTVRESGAGGDDEEPRAASPASKLVVEWVMKGLANIDRALATGPGSPEALTVRGALRFWLWFDGGGPDTLVSAAERDFRAAVASDSGLAEAWYGLSSVYLYTARFPQSDQAARRALDADAYLSEAWEVISGLFFNALNGERFDDARYWCDRGRQRFPDQRNFIDCELRIMGWSAQGKPEVARAWEIVSTIEQRSPDSTLWADRRMMVALILARTGLTDSAKAVIRQTRAALAGRRWQADDMAFAEGRVWLLLGNEQEALRRLAVYLEAFPQYRTYVAQSPWFRPLRTDPRFQALVKEAS